MTLREALARAAAQGLARIDAQLLLLHVLGRVGTERGWLVAHDDEALAPAAEAAYADLCSRRNAGEPLAYLTGEKEFFGLPLQVDARVLVPRPDTETIVEWALELLRPLRAPRVIDLGTGSGAIALAIQRARPDARVEAVDRSAEALAVARANAQRLQLPVQFRQADWLAGAGRYDLVVSNPPYVRAQDEHLAALRHEPLSALVAGEDGLADLRAIVGAAPAHLAPGGWLLLEHGWDQAAAVEALLAAAGFTRLSNRKDLGGIVRCSGGQAPELG
ncbi:MAG TPA: peptide chain release factor N(5)-glutamine methyltransferase [Ramlibacter sp.]|uniref:peptide chain release factor N(5)-glutamine methyltransferase n=1 Tax=Ramlibacter sp. TaxID=1917967 RepID=UPI002D7FC550|nr:peptide chain release factor N(5)-glutamine methyltransferase [Ramlibacter sp.]HET8744410.1 peptide chain release factor N(5)-glutamine methyltransferase [Ramlibacter sp.]